MTEPTSENQHNENVVLEEPKLPSDEQRKFIEMKAKDYRIQGMSDEEAEKLATEDWQKEAKQATEHNEEVWNEIVKKVNLADFLDDQIRRALGVYKTNFAKKVPGMVIDFKLELKTLGGIRGRLIAGAQLQLQYAINGNWKAFSTKEVKFQHIREMQQGHLWKLALYEAMLQDVIAWGVTYRLQIDRYNEQSRQSATTGETIK